MTTSSGMETQRNRPKKVKNEIKISPCHHCLEESNIKTNKIEEAVTEHGTSGNI